MSLRFPPMFTVTEKSPMVLGGGREEEIGVGLLPELVSFTEGAVFVHSRLADGSCGEDPLPVVLRPVGSGPDHGAEPGHDLVGEGPASDHPVPVVPVLVDGCDPVGVVVPAGCSS